MGGLQGLLPALAEHRRQLTVPAPEELRRRPRQPQPLPVLPPPEMPPPRHVQRRSVAFLCHHFHFHFHFHLTFPRTKQKTPFSRCSESYSKSCSKYSDDTRKWTRRGRVLETRRSKDTREIPE